MEWLKVYALSSSPITTKKKIEKLKCALFVKVGQEAHSISIE
jgi:hypothetical protein